MIVKPISLHAQWFFAKLAIVMTTLTIEILEILSRGLLHADNSLEIEIVPFSLRSGTTVIDGQNTRLGREINSLSLDIQFVFIGRSKNIKTGLEREL